MKWVYLAAIFIPLFAAIYYNSFQVLPRLANAELEALRKKEYSKAYFAYTTEEFKDKFDLFEFKAFVQRHPIFAHYDTFRIVSSDLNKGVIHIDLSGPDMKEKLTLSCSRVGTEWKIDKFKLTHDSLPYVDEEEPVIKKMIETVASAIKNNETVDVYYTYMSGDFQNKTVLGSFQEMIEFYSPFSAFESLEFLDKEKKDLLHQVWKVGLHQKGGDSTAQFSLVKENGFWKIAALELLGTGSQPKDPESIIQAQLQAIRSLEVAKAYFDFTSKEFQKSISLHDFKSLLKKQKAFFYHSQAQLKPIKKTKVDSVVKATLSSIDDRPLPVEFELIYEDKAWKINHIVMN